MQVNNNMNNGMYAVKSARVENSVTTIDTLPKDLQANIFEFLAINEVAKSSRAFRCLQKPMNRYTADFSHYLLADIALRYFVGIRELITYDPKSKELGQLIEQNKGLRKITMWGHTDLVESLAKLSEINSLTIEHPDSKLTDLGISAITGMNLIHLKISGKIFSGGNFAYILANPSFCITAAQIETMVKALINLQSLGMDKCPVNDQVMKSVALHNSLTSLELSSCIMTDQQIRSIATMTRLRALAINNCTGFRSIECSAFASLQNLTYLAITYAKGVDERVVQPICSIRSLTYLSIGSAPINNKCLEFIGTLSNLKELNLHACFRIDDEGLKNLNPLHNLTSLDLSYCHGITITKIPNILLRPKLEVISKLNQIPKILSKSILTVRALGIDNLYYKTNILGKEFPNWIN